MRALLSPYELDEWSPAAMAALSLFDAVATVRPELRAPGDSETGQRSMSVRETPALASLLDRWHWTGALWQAGVLQPDAEGQSVLHEARRAASAIQAEPRFAPLQRLAGRPWHDDPANAAEALAADLLRNGADPSIHLPVVAGLESLATRTGGVLCRGEGVGMLSRLERRNGSRAVARFAMPTLIGGEGGALLSMRERLASPRETLLRAIESALLIATRDSASCRVLDAADEYARAFDSLFGGVAMLRGSHASDGIRRVMLVVSIASTPPAPTLGATARLASIVGGRRHDRQLAAAAARQATPERPIIADPDPSPEHLLVATVRRVAWEPLAG